MIKSRELNNKSRRSRRRYSREYDRKVTLRNSRHSKKQSRVGITSTIQIQKKDESILEKMIESDYINDIKDSGVLFSELEKNGYKYTLSSYERHDKLKNMLNIMNIETLYKKIDKLRKLVKQSNYKCSNILYCDMKWISELPEYTVYKQQQLIQKAPLKSSSDKKSRLYKLSV